MSGDPPICRCPSVWNSVIPYNGYCPFHNPNVGCAGNWFYPSYPTTEFKWPEHWPVKLSEEDLERIAQRVAELLKPVHHCEACGRVCDILGNTVAKCSNGCGWKVIK